MSLTINANMIKNNLRFFATLIALMFYAWYSIYMNEAYAVIAFLIVVVMLATGDSTENFYLLVALIPFERVTQISNKNIFFIYFAIAIFKLLLEAKILNFSKRIVTMEYLFLIFIVFEIANDLLKIKPGELIHLLMMLLYFIMFILFYRFNNYDHKVTLKYFISSYFVVIYASLMLSGGSFSVFLESSSNINSVRFGESARSLGGAMGLPLYSLLIICFLFKYLLNNKTSFIKSISLFVLIIIPFSLGFLSVSKLYLLGLALIFISLIISLPTRKFVRIMKLFFVMSVFGYVVALKYYVALGNIVNNFAFRLQVEDISTGRFDIYKSCFDYLTSHVNAMFFGLGAKNYVQVGLQEGYLFSFLAHNIFLDALMSWGIVGTIILILFLKYFYDRCRDHYLTKINIINLMPAIVLFGCFMTEGSFNYIKTYFYILLVIINIFAIDKNVVVGDIGDINERAV